ncbi:MAG: response regulator [Kiritimatiellales bacterium]|jgi:two-component system KDP operon response regulator KdpE
MSLKIVLIIDDEVQIRRLLKVTLEAEQYRVYEAETGQTGLIELAHRKPDVVLLDLGLPDMDGIDVLRRLREWSKVPVLILSVRQGVEDKVSALDAGADDYLTKPFHSAELTARLRAIQRHTAAEMAEPVFECASLQIDFSSRTVKRDGQEISLTATEYALLRVLAQNAGKVVTHRQLLREVWGPQAEEQAQYLRVYMNHLRKKLGEPAGQPRLLRNEPGIGYRLMC